MNDITCRRPISWKHSAKTDTGTVRDVNEDAMISRPDVKLWAVADGMGGHAVGDVASAKVIAALEYVEEPRKMSEFVSDVEDRVIAVNSQLIEYAKIMLDDATIGTTLVSLLIRDQLGVCLWVGDSRLYRFRNNVLAQLSRDHSQVEELLKMGMITEAEVENHPQGNVITRAVGVEETVFVDINAFRIQTGDTYLLCSDGLYNAVTAESIAESLNHRDLETSTDELIQKALDNGARDNVTVIVVRGEPGKYADEESFEAEALGNM